MSNRVGLAVYTRAGAPVASSDLVGSDAKATWWISDGPLATDELDDRGFFSFNVQADATNVADIEPGHIVVVSLDAAPIWRGVIRKRVWREVAEDEVGRYATFTGVGEVGRLEEMRVYPPGGLGRFPFPDERAFNWTAPEFDDGAWVAAVVTPANYGTSSENFGLPEGFPFGTAEWIWNVNVSGGGIPARVKYFRKAVNVAADGVYEAWSAADDRNEVWLSGKSILKSSDAPYDGRTTAAELFITDGWVQVAARAENRNTLKAGLLFGIGKPLEVGDTPIVVTDATWRVAPDGAELGMNAGQIMDILLDEFEARGGVAPARTWTSLLDSAANPWTTCEEVTVPVGSSVLDVLLQMVELEMCEFRMSPDAFELNLYNPASAGSVVDYTLDDTSLTSLTWESAPAVSTAMLVRYERGWTDTDDSALLTAHGRREEMLSLGGVASRSAAEAQAERVIAKFGTDRTEIGADIDPAAQLDEPYTKYRPGDSITVPGPVSYGWNAGVWGDGNWNEDGDGEPVPQKVLAVALGVDDAGNPTWAVHLNSHIEELEKRQQLLLKRLAGGSVGGRSQSTTIPYEPRPIQPRDPQEEVWSTPNPVVIVGERRTFARAVRVREFRMDLRGTITGTYTARLLKNGTPITGSTISRTSEGESYVTLGEIITQRPADYIQAEITAVGSGATGMTLTAVYA